MDLDWEHYASVAIGYTLKAPKLDRISNDHFETMSDLLEIIRRRGYQRVGCYLWEVDNERMARRARSAFLSVSQGAGVEVVTYRDFEPDPFVRWIRRGKFDAVVFQGRAQFEALKRAGVAVPDDLGAVGYALERSEQEIAGMYHNNRRIGASAEDWVSGKFQRGQFGFGPSVHRILVASDWLENKTLAAPAP